MPNKNGVMHLFGVETTSKALARFKVIPSLQFVPVAQKIRQEHCYIVENVAMWEFKCLNQEH